MKIREKDKYLIYNEDYKVLIFKKMCDNYIELFIPNNKVRGYDNSRSQEFNKFINYNNLFHLVTDIDESIIYEHENYKLKKIKLKIIRNYYSCYKEFTKDEIAEINEICYRNDVSPYFVTIEELNEIIDGMSHHDVDVRILKALDELDKRLKYIKY